MVDGAGVVNAPAGGGVATYRGGVGEEVESQEITGADRTLHREKIRRNLDGYLEHVRSF